jgi:hypothetical protein
MTGLFFPGLHSEENLYAFPELLDDERGSRPVVLIRMADDRRRPFLVTKSDERKAVAEYSFAVPYWPSFHQPVVDRRFSPEGSSNFRINERVFPCQNSNRQT